MPAPSRPHSSLLDVDLIEPVLKHLSEKHPVSLGPTLASQHQHSTSHICQNMQNQKIEQHLKGKRMNIDADFT